jgi:peptidoglycan lytic transglycosylase G
LRTAIGIAVTLLLTVVIAVLWVDAVMTRPMTLAGDGLILEVPRGGSLAGVLDDLGERGVVAHPQVVRRYASLVGDANRVQAGEFLIPAGSTPADLISILVEGQALMHSFTIVEGWTFREMLSALQAEDAIEAELVDADAAEILRAIGASETHPEGLFLPDTYHFPRGETDTAFLRRAYRAMRAFLAESWDARDPEVAVTDAYQALILASIIEKETAVPDERPAIAGVFDRRLRLGMRLETDPTVIYGLGAAFDGNLRRRDLDQDTPYNTYTRRGLPPTPIALPSPAAILAALHPAAGDALYFVAIGDGRHYFSASYDEHLEAVRRYQLRRRGGG